MVCQDGVEALDCLEDFAPDLVITDFYMPRMTGGELIQRRAPASRRPDRHPAGLGDRPERLDDDQRADGAWKSRSPRRVCWEACGL
jgi:hypothetical protein